MSAPCASHRLAFAAGVYFAQIEEEAVVMSLRSNRYYGLSRVSACIWSLMAEGHSEDDVTERLATEDLIDRANARDVVRLQIEEWRRSGLIVDSADPAPVLLRHRPPGSPARSALDRERLERTRLGPGSFLRFILSAARTRRSLRRDALIHVLENIQDKPVRPGHDPEACIYPVVKTYQVLRSLFQQGNPDCLPRSVALMSMLRAQGVDAELCFGVQKFPFLAHAWVEWRGVSINENPEGLAKFHVIARF